MTAIDLSPILTPVLTVVGIALASVATWAIGRLGQKLGIQANGAAMQNLDSAATKAVQAAVMATQDQIRAKSWDHPDVQNALVAYGAQYLVTQFAGTLAQSGIDPSTSAGSAAIANIVTRALPAGVAVAAASPVTPPVTSSPSGASS